MIPDQTALIRSILFTPEDDAPRLVYADWLEENGEGERAEFIRVQCELAHMPKPPVVVTEECYPQANLGPDYFELSGGENTEGNSKLIMDIEVGSRVDLMKPKKLYKGKLAKPLLGLRVQKITDDSVILAQDAKSGPWSGWKLRRRERELLFDNWPKWCLDLGLNYTIRCGDDNDYSACRNHDEEVFRFKFRRGFVDFVSCRLDQFMGGTCERCGGDCRVTQHGGQRWSEVGGNPFMVQCADCCGTGRTSGAVEVFKSQPVTRVVLTDKIPYTSFGDKWAWSADDEDEGIQSWLPDCLWSLLEPKGFRRNYESRELAISALSAACVQYGRNHAKLNLPLPV